MSTDSRPEDTDSRPEPALTAGSITAAVAAVVALVAAFGLDLDAEQTAAILGVAAVVAPLIVAVIVRPQVTPKDAPQTDAGVPLMPAPVEPGPITYGG